MVMFLRKIFVFILFASCIITLKGQSELDRLRFDSVYNSLKIQQEKCFGCLSNLEAASCQFLCQNGDTLGHTYYRINFTNFYATIFNNLLNKGLDLNLNYNKIECFRWSVMVPIDTSNEKGRSAFANYEKARLENQTKCERIEIHKRYIDTCNAFHSYYQSFYKNRGVGYSEIKYIIKEHSSNLSVSNYNEILRILRKCKCTELPLI
jgi:hypothetical protein